MVFSVATYNVHRCIGQDRIRSPARIADVLNQMDADLMALQEVAYDAAAPGNVLEVLAESTNAEVIPGPTLLGHQGRYGNAILTRTVPEHVERRNISVPGREPRGAIAIMLRINGRMVKVVATHLGLRPRERRSQMNQIMPLVDRPAAAVKILLGDFNEWHSWGAAIRRAIHRFGRLPAPPTFPTWRPLLALDRIWIHPADKLISLRPHRSVLSRTASDHLPLIARIRI